MIRLCFYRRGEDILGFAMKGHAEAAPYGEDIVCAGISALMINTINSMEHLLSFEKETEFRNCKGCFFYGLRMSLMDSKSIEKAQILLKSFQLGASSVEKSYPLRIKILTREV